MNEDGTVIHTDTKKPAYIDEELDKILEEHKKVHRHKNKPGFTYIDPNYLRGQMDQLHDAFERGYTENRANEKDWMEMLRDPKARRDDVFERMVE